MHLWAKPFKGLGLKGLGRSWLATTTPKTSKKQPIRPFPLLLNHNLRFQANNYELFLIPKHPRLTPNSGKAIIIDPESVVMQLFFVRKSSSELEEQHGWQQSEVFEFKFEQLAAVLDVQAGKGQEYDTFGQRSGDQKLQSSRIKIRDNHKDKRICFSKSAGFTEQNSGSKTAHFEEGISYQDFTILQTIINESLYDLSGMRLILDIKRTEELQQIKKAVNLGNQKMKEMQDYYGKQETN